MAKILYFDGNDQLIGCCSAKVSSTSQELISEVLNQFTFGRNPFNLDYSRYEGVVTKHPNLGNGLGVPTLDTNVELLESPYYSGSQVVVDSSSIFFLDLPELTSYLLIDQTQITLTRVIEARTVMTLVLGAIPVKSRFESALITSESQQIVDDIKNISNQTFLTYNQIQDFANNNIDPRILDNGEMRSILTDHLWYNRGSLPRDVIHTDYWYLGDIVQFEGVDHEVSVDYVDKTAPLNFSKFKQL